MEKNWTTIVLILLVLILVIVNIGQFTGQTTKQEVTTKIIIEPDTLKAGEELNIKIIPGDKCTNEKVSIYGDDNIRLGTVYDRVYNSFKYCRTIATMNYKTGGDWEPGVYYVKAFDYGAQDYAKAYFTIIE